MKIAVTYENGDIFQHFGHTEQVKVYDVQDKKIISSEVISTDGNGHGAIAGFLKNIGVEVLICGGIGEGAKQALANEGIVLRGGVLGSADKAVEDFINDTLIFNENVSCSHHHDDKSGHKCSSHSCSSNNKKYNGVTVLTSENFKEEVEQCDDLVIVDFWAVWCGPCQMLSPIIDALSEEISDVKFCKVNVDEQQELAMKYNIHSIPTVAFIKNNKVLDLSVGYVPKEELLERIDNNK